MSCFVFIGLSQSIVFPTLVAVIGSWFAKAKRGLITGSWGTCTNIGNILGVQIAARILKSNNNHWEILMLIISCLFMANVIGINTLFKPSPDELNLIIEVEDKVSLVKEHGQ